MVEVDGRSVRVSNPDKVYFPAIGATKLDLVSYYLTVAAGALVGCRERPTMLHRYPDGVEGKEIYQKRVPHPPEWIDTVTVTFPSGREARFLCPTDAAHVIWAVNLGCLEMNPWNVRRPDVDHPDELRIDLDPTPQAPFADVRRVAMEVREVLPEHGLVGFPKTSGKRGIHIYCRIEPRWSFFDVRIAALALGRQVTERIPELVTVNWWKEERHGVFMDFNQNARDRTIASAYSVRPMPDGRVSCPLDWDEVRDVEPEDLTLRTVPKRFAEKGDPGAGIDGHVGSLDSLLTLAERQKGAGYEEAPWPPHFPKQREEPRRVSPSRRARGSRRRFAADE
jgi:DNA ligase D-like protein (predicted polymerase)